MEPEQQLSKAEAKRERRRQRKAAEAAAARAAARRRQIRMVAAGVAVVGVVAAGLWFALRPDDELAGVEHPPNGGRQHLAAGETHQYDDPAPTSGPHALSAPPCGLHQEELDPVLAVHALEHGAVVLWHQPDIADTERQALIDLMRQYESHVIVSPNSGIGSEVVATAWNRRKAYEAGDPEIAEFVETYRRRGPERVDCPV